MLLSRKALSKIWLRNKYAISGKFLFSLSLVDPSLEMDTFHIVSYQNIMESNYSIWRIASHKPFLEAIL